MATLAERKAEYELHKDAGWDYYNSFRSQLTLDIEAETKTQEECLAIHARMSVVGTYLQTGDWKSAYDNIIRLAPDFYCTVDIIESVKSDIIAYITENYTW